MRTLVFATNNPHKLDEARAIAAGRLHIVGLDEAGLAGDIPETEPTLRGNALLKARWVADRLPGCDCLADDTGLMVDALDGAPGVMSARYAGEGCTPADNIDKLLKALDGVAAPRTARFVTEIALIEGSKPGSEPRFFTGTVEGEILGQRDGTAGFGYDPVFRPQGSALTFAAMEAEAKNAMSHRGRALRAMIEALAADDDNNR